MLEAMSKILVFSDEEKELLGLVKKKQSIGEKLINYFLADDEDE